MIIASSILLIAALLPATGSYSHKPGVLENVNKLGNVLLRHSRPLRRDVDHNEKPLITKRQQRDANVIIDYLTKGPGKGQTYAWLEHLTDKYGNRYAPGKQYDVAADFLISQLREAGVDNVWAEDAPGVPHWFRGSDPARPDQVVMLQPRHLVIPVLALGNSTATPPGGIQAHAVVVRSFDELAALPESRVKGSIVVYNQPWLGSYGKSVLYRVSGATEAAKRGAVAALVRSVTPQSLYTLHTGWNHYDVNNSKWQIPVASITVEDAELLYRLQETGQPLELLLQLNTVNYGTIAKRNVIAEIRGSTNPDEMVLFGGHLDSWDVGTGAMDDGGGVAITWQALLTMKALGLRPKRSVRAVFWTAEEFNYVGSHGYYEAHKQESDKISLAMESDTGTFTPQGLHFAGNAAAQRILQQVMDMLAPINATQLPNDGDVPGDPEPFYENDGVPSVELMTANEKYFWYHHSEADTMTMMDSAQLDACAAVFTTVAYVVADLDELLPHGKTGDNGKPATRSAK